MRPRIVGAISVLAVLQFRAARSEVEDPCAADVTQFCSDVKVGHGRVQECLRQHEARLSPQRGAKRAAAAAKLRGYVEEYASACRRDAARLCSGVKPGSGRIVACLIRQQDELSTACEAKTERVRAATETITTMRAECRSDVERLCPGVPSEAGPLVECLQANREGLSAACRSLDPEMPMAAAQLVDAINAISTEKAAEEIAQILQGSTRSRSHAVRSSSRSTATKASAEARTPTGSSSTRSSCSAPATSSRFK
jgi:hypothetical protein